MSIDNGSVSRYVVRKCWFIVSALFGEGFYKNPRTAFYVLLVGMFPDLDNESAEKNLTGENVPACRIVR